MSFTLSPRLKSDCLLLGKLPLSQLLLLNNAYFRWFILVPEVDVEQLHLLTAQERAQLFQEAHDLSTFLDKLYNPIRINVGAIGNVVSQLHYHVVCRSSTDPAWPNVVWGFPEATPYQPEEIEGIKDAITPFLQSY